MPRAARRESASVRIASDRDGVEGARELSWLELDIRRKWNGNICEKFAVLKRTINYDQSCRLCKRAAETATIAKCHLRKTGIEDKRVRWASFSGRSESTKIDEAHRAAASFGRPPAMRRRGKISIEKERRRRTETERENNRMIVQASRRGAALRKTRELSTAVSTVDNRLAGGRGLSRA